MAIASRSHPFVVGVDTHARKHVYTILTDIVAEHEYPVAEAPRIDTTHYRGVGKSDALDAHRSAAAALPLPAEK